MRRWPVLVVRLAALGGLLAGLAAPAVAQSGAQSAGQSAGAEAPGADKVLRVCQDPNNLPLSNRAGEGFENKIAALFA